MQAFLGLAIISKIISVIYKVMAVILFFIAYLSLRDIIIFLRQGKKEVILKLTDKQNIAIRNIIREKLRMEHYIAGAAISGFFVSLTELACTGQIYLPTIMYILDVPALRKQAFIYLLMYNTAFIAPLVIIFILSLSGITALNFARISKANFIWGKLLLCLLFIALGVIILLKSPD